MSLASRRAWRKRWRKNSIGAAFPKWRTTGGFYAGACPRSRRIATEKRHLKRKWKSHIRLETYKSQDRTAMDVPRRQSVKL